MRDDLPTGVVSFLLTDIEGSTRLLHQIGAEAYAEVLTDHRRLLRDSFTSHGGVEVDTQGDAFFVAFARAADCLRASVEMQQVLAGHDWGEAATLKVRMGVHTGAAQTTDEGYVGMSVHTAARIASAGHGGQILLSAATADAVQAEVETSDFDLRDMGEHHLKDVDGVQRLYQVVIPGLPSDFSPPRTLETRPNNLPTPPTPFIGRASLVAEVRDLVLQDDVRLVTLVGPGGTGKSRLGLRVATELLYHFDDGAYFIPLASLKDPDLVPATIASTLDIREADNKPITQAIAEALSDKNMLLLIDNSEQVQAAARHIGEIMRQCPSLKALITSREAINLSGARTIRVPPFELPDSKRLPPLDELRQFESVSLFVERAQAARQEFELTDDNAGDVVEICRRVDALPLAIELAAARIRSMQPDRLLKALDRRFKVLTGGAEDLLDHQKSLRELIAWSYDLLDPAEQRLWRRLAIFVGGCTMDAAQDVCDADDEFFVEVDVESLINKSLVNLEFDDAATGAGKLIDSGLSEPRLRMLDTLREYALDQLNEAGERDQFQDRFNGWFLELAETAEPEFRGPKLETWLERLEREQNNFRGVLEDCLLEASGKAKMANQLCAALWFFWYQRGFLSEARSWLEQSLADASVAHDATYGKALHGLSVIARHQNQLPEAVQHANAALSVYRSLSDDAGIAASLVELGAVAERDGNYAEAAGYLDEALGLLRATGGRPDRLAHVLITRGVIFHIEGDLEEAKRYYAESLAVGSDLGDKNSIATATVNLGEIAELQGNLEEARDQYRASLKLYGELSHRLAVAYCLEVLAGLETRLGNPADGALLFGAAEALREELDAPIESFNEARLTKDVQATRDAAGDATFEAKRSEGRQMAGETALLHALGIDEMLG